MQAGGACEVAAAGKVAAEASGARSGPPAAKSLGLGRDPAPSASRPESRAHMFILSVPFPTPLHAGIALGSLAPDAEPHQGAIGKELATRGSTLDVLLEQLSLVVQTMQRFGPPVSR
ncbi:EKC/KEOPS complex subunit LAGE3 isoform X2 [Octodon degus]|uniref:EKC/KEOPS complex subunit LAGE3 isoform X2 n=1 Tax=Octodon degus TaxID=10160 RepID=A0A6P6DMG1_OCTDE|nr:EKC/KEOPS complex subunit LAGE3 isoform X2 [Octodon degus]